MGLDRRAVVVGAGVHGRAGGVHMAAAVLCHGGNLEGPNTAGSHAADQRVTRQPVSTESTLFTVIY